ncbi:branched-chain amino acid transport system substrate-binding protein [Butyrivibrio fibrisolvens DSM 3071]|uniref:Branched-chain amino acid transport system substrate-binding protein n=1 Tax=Butyrivibrio fibrisolvens DSM 3071 TaxID=1121131 RepID=A0A1M5Z7I3_BUTFI|nr:ABC transporter substrate-binding protein [Butyrivibrio fibrisolvens]SHI20048.1 branched-chain amino acid transport system substrate-binding protein [Butyrivibrio fibrisolvens DSM 3071]
MKKKLLSISMCAALALSLITGCGAGSESGSSSSSSSDVFKIGAIGPLTGGAAAYGNAVQWGAQIAVDEINEAGGINGYKIEYKAEDDECDNQKSVNAYNTLKDWGAQFIVGSTTSGCCIAVADEAHNDNIFQITPSGSAVDCVKYDNAFRVCFSDPAQGTASAQYIGEKKLATKVAIIYDSSDVYSSGITETFVAEAANQGLEIVSQEAFTADSKTDFSVQIQKAIDGQAELIFLPIYYSEAALILQQASTMGATATFFGCDGMDGILGVENFDTSLAEGLMLLTPFSADATDDLTKNFVAKFQEAHQIVPNQFAADAYDAVYAIKAAAEKAGITPDMSVSDICNAMKTAMTEISVDGLTSLGMTWSAAGEPTKEPKAVVIKNGEYVLAE